MAGRLIAWGFAAAGRRRGIAPSARRPRRRRDWAAALFAALGLPAAWLSGAMAGAAVFALSGFTAVVPSRWRDVVYVVLGVSMGAGRDARRRDLAAADLAGDARRARR